MPYLLFTDANGRKMGVEIDSAVVIGREETCDIHIPNPMLSRRHCRFMHTKAGWVVQDLKSSRGTYFESQKIDTHVLAGGEVIAAGDIKITFLAHAPQGARKLAKFGTAAAALAKPRSVEDEVLDVLTAKHDDDEDDLHGDQAEADLAAIRQELGGESDVAAMEPEVESEMPREAAPEPVIEKASAPAAAVVQAPRPAPQPFVRPEVSHLRGADLWDIASAPIPMQPKGKKKKIAPIKKGTSATPQPAAATSASAAQQQTEPANRPAWFPEVRWDKKTIVTCVIVCAVIVVVLFETTGDSISTALQPSAHVQSLKLTPEQMAAE